MNEVWLDAPAMELHIANIMVAAKFIIERDSTIKGQVEGMQQILQKLRELLVNFMTQRNLNQINLQTSAALLATFIKRG